MNIQYNLTETGGFPLDQGVLNDLQKGILETESALANLVGPLVIISGCVVAGLSAGNGILAINGQIFPFVGGVIGPKVIIVETDGDLTYFNGSIFPANITRVAQFGDDGVQNNPWANFVRVTAEGVIADVANIWQTGDVKQIDCTEVYIAANFVSAGPTLGLGTNARLGWAICNGNNGTVNRLGKVAVQRDPSQIEFSSMTAAGCEKTHLLTIAEMPGHGHSFIDPTGGDDFGSSSTRPSNTSANPGTTGSTGGDQAHNNLQPYMVSLFIQKL